MPDDLTLRLRTLRNLSWEEVSRDEHPWRQDPTKTVTVIVYTRNDEYDRVWLLDGKPEWRRAWSIPDYPNDLGACAEVLAAIEARGWEWEASYGIFEDGGTIHSMEIRSGYLNPIAEAEALTLPAAICLAFCEAVEASGASAPSE